LLIHVNSSTTNPSEARLTCKFEINHLINFPQKIASRLLSNQIFFNSKISALDPDDLLAEGVTFEDGKFELSGSESEITDIDPKVNVYHV
jgi:hypothetical protein